MRNEKGEAVTAIMMGAMLVVGLILWLAPGDFHRMHMLGGGKHVTEESVAHGEKRAKPDAAQEEGHDKEGEEHGERRGMDTP